ncbi:MAG: hypothetical protein PVS3B3_31930 [Ktedonobacteraceae bacterium]
MPKTPIGGDEQDNIYSHKQVRPQRPAQQTYVQSRKNRAESVATYHSDEHPHIPRIRRASRFVEEEQPLPIVTNKLPEVDELDELFEEELDEEETRTPTRRETTGKILVSPQRRRPYIDDLPSSRPRSSSLTKVQHSQRPVRPSGTAHPRQGTARHHSQERYARYGRREKRPQTRTLFAALQDFRHNRTLIMITVGVLLTVIFVPMLINITVNSLHSTSSGIISGMDQGSGGSQGVGQQQTDPHTLVITPPETDHPAPPVFATSAYLLDADTGATLYAHNPFLHLPMMSTTKLMTATLAIERGNLDQKVTINDAIARDLGSLSADSSLMGIKKGETYTLRELMYGLMLVSGNDAAIAIGDTIAGNLPSFVAMMNEKARSLGLLDTHYMNPHGLLATNHYSSAHDLAMMGRYAFSLPKLREIDGTRTFDIAQNGSHAGHHMFNGNQFLWWYPGVDGGKPGWDGGGNFVQVISCTRNGHHLIGVTMHTNNWWTDMRDLMNWGFNTFSWISPYDVDLHNPIPYDNLWNYFTDDKKDITIPTSDSGRYYIYTGFSVSSLILDYFDQNGGLGKFGYPTSLLLVSGSSTISQRFEHNSIQCDAASKQCKTV